MHAANAIHGPNAYIERLYREALAAAAGHDLTDAKVREQQRKKLKRILRIDACVPDPLDPVLLEREDCGDYIRERVEIGTEGGLRMPVYVLLPKDAEFPVHAVLALHGHGYGSRELVGIGPDGSPRQEGEGIHKHFALSLVRRGFIAIVPELLGFGERRLQEDEILDATPEDQRKSSCYKLSSYLIHLGRSLAGIRAYEVTRAIDYALTREEVRRDGLGSMGLSGGALAGYLSAAVDERIAAVVLSGYTNTYEDSYFFAKQHCLCDYISGITELGDMPDLISLIAPRAVFLEAGREDPLFPLEGVLKAGDDLRLIYEKQGVSERFGLHIFEGKHEISGLEAYRWLAVQLGHREGQA